MMLYNVFSANVMIFVKIQQYNFIYVLSLEERDNILIFVFPSFLTYQLYLNLIILSY